MLNSEILENYMERFWGYGSYKAPVWFVGIEHGGGESIDELNRRLTAWNDRGRRELEDLAEYHEAIGELRWTRPTPRLQSTWKELVRITLATHGDPTDNESVRMYQRDELGRPTGSTCLIELLPLPARDNRAWPYAEWSTLKSVRDRETYMNDVGIAREIALRELIERHSPRTVVFYGLGFKPQWERVTRARFRESDIERVCLAHADRTSYLLTPHPVARGVSPRFFERIGQYIRSECLKDT